MSVVEQSEELQNSSSQASDLVQPLQTAQVQEAAPPKPAGPKLFIDAAQKPTQKGPEGIRYDFNNGCRVELPVLTGGEKWKLRFSDLETFNIIFETESEGGLFQSTKVYYVPIKIEVWRNDRLVLDHSYTTDGHQIQVQLPVGILGDVIAWFPYVDAFQRKHGCKLTCVLSDPAHSMFGPEYPNIKFVSPKEAESMQNDFYATYRMGLFFDDWNCTHQPFDFRYVGLHKTAAHILGVEPIEAPPRIHVSDEKRLISEPYVCIAVQSSTQCKYWNNPLGWIEIVKWLKEAGYRVLCIDREPAHGHGLSWNYMPHGAEDFTGSLPLPERAALLKHADFFVGLSSGLAWVAWAAGTPVVMISGFTHPNNEFHTPYRVFNHHVCNSCWNDPKVMFDHFDFQWCPRHKGTDRQFECTRLITIDHVKSVIRTIPGFRGETPKAKPSKKLVLTK